MVAAEESRSDMSVGQVTDSPLAAVTTEGLRRMGQRRAVLLAARGLAVLCGLIAVACLVLAFADRSIVLSEGVRWRLATAFCLVLVGGGVFVALPLWRRWEEAASAMLIEEAMPSLRHRLLAAVEFATAKTSPAAGSRAFRTSLQEIVASEMQGFRPASVLPWRKVRRPMVVAMTAVACCSALFAIPSLALPQHLLRVLFPSANIARPSPATLRFLAPAASDTIVPLHERLAVDVEIELPESLAFGMSETIRLEVEALGDRDTVQTIELVRQQNDSDRETTPGRLQRYIGQWLVDRPRMRYRAISSIGETPWFELEAVARPAVDDFEITVTPPDYAGVAPTTTVAPVADVAAVVGSQVRWSLKPSRSLSSASLTWLDAAAADSSLGTLRCEQTDGGRWSLDIPVVETRRLQFDLVGLEGIANEFPVTSRLTAIEDEPPRLVWRQPEVHEATVPATSSHMLEVELADEFPVTSVEQWTRINRGEWVTTPVVFEHDLAEQTIAWSWALVPLGLVPGDLVESRLVAVDRRGLQGSSPTLEWVVSESLLNLAAAPANPARRQIAAEIGELVANLEQLVGEDAVAALSPPAADATGPQDLSEVAASMRAAADQLAREAAEVRDSIHTTLAETEDRLAAEELSLTSAVLSRLEHEDAATLRQAADALDAVVGSSEQDSAIARAAAAEQVKRVREKVQQLDRRFDSLVGQDVLDEAASRLDAAARFQAEIVARPEMIGSETHQREQQLLAGHLRALAASLGRDEALLPAGSARQAADRRRWAEDLADRLERSATPRGDKPEEAVRSEAQVEAREVLNQLEGNRSVHGMYPSLSGEARQSRRELRQLAGSSAEVVTRTAEELKKTEGTIANATQAAEATLSELMDRRAAMLAQASTKQASTAADLGAAYRGLVGLVTAAATDPEEVRETFEQGKRALQTLEAAGRLEAAMGWVDQMLATERDASDRVTAHNATPRIWEATSQELEDAGNAMRQAGLPAELADRVRAARWSPAAEEIGRKVSPRQWDLSSTVSAATDLAVLRGELQQHFDALQGPIAEARAVLQDLSPSIPDLAREAAERAAAQQQKVEQLAAEAEAGDTTDLEAVLPDTSPADDEIIARLESALVDAAATQDLLDATERERARDADLARELVNASQERVDEATADARQDTGEDQGAALAELADAYEQAGETFAMIAEHFDRDPLAADASNQADSSASLEQAAARQAPQAAAKLEDAYQEAEQLGAVAETPPDELLRRLEQELQTNLPMREALSDIAGGLATQSQQALEFAAERERTLRHDVESSDAKIREEKKQFVAELRVLNEQAARVAQRLGQEAQRQAEAAGLPDRQQQLTKTAEALEKAVEAVRTVPDTAGVPDLIQAASQLDQAIDTAAPGLREASQALSAAASQAPEQSEDQQRRALSEATVASGRWHQQDVRWADQDLRTRERRVQEADRLTQEANRQLEQAAAQLDRARQQQAANPEDTGRQEQLQRAEVQQREAESLASLSRDIRQREERRLEEARELREQVGRQPEVLNAANPHAQLAERLTNDATSQASQLSDRLGTMLANAGWREQLQSSQGQLAKSALQQETVTATVADAARSLERAAAHEMRLGGFAAAGQLADAAQRVDATSRQEPVAAETALAEASESSEAMSTAGRATNSASQAAVESLSRAGEAIAQRADELARLLSPTADSEDGTNSRESTASQSGQSSGQSDAGSRLLEPAEMARLLDQLDRELRQSQPGDPSSPSQSGEASATQRSLQRSSSQLAKELQQQRGVPGTPQPQEQQSASMQDSQATPSMASQSSNGQLTDVATGQTATDVRLLEADGRDVFVGGWNRLREQQAGEVVESVRKSVSPRYRRQVEQYFRGLSERGQASGGAP
jgi:hypothetical protein